MRNIRENMTSQQWLFHAVQGENQRRGPSCGIYERIKSLIDVVPSRERTKERALHMEEKKEQDLFSKLFHTIQRANQIQGPVCGIYERLGPLSKFIQCGPGWEPKAGPSMRNILENRAPQQNVFHAVHGGNQKQGPPCGIQKRIGPLSNVDAWCNSAGIKDRALHAPASPPPPHTGRYAAIGGGEGLVLTGRKCDTL